MARKAAYRKGRQNRLAMLLVTTVVLMMALVVTFKSVELRQKRQIYMEKEEKRKALDAAISHIEKQYGKGAVMKLGDPIARMNVETIPTGSLSLDIALGRNPPGKDCGDLRPGVQR